MTKTTIVTIKKIAKNAVINGRAEVSITNFSLIESKKVRAIKIVLITNWEIKIP